MVKILRIFLYILSAVFLLNSIVLVFRKSFTLGLVIMFCLSFAFFILGRWWDMWAALTASGPGMYFKYIVLLGAGCYLLLCGFVLSYAKTTVNFREKAVIVLGCGLNSDGTPSPTLQKRLDGCIDYHSRNPDAYIVVTGGYSRFNNCTEGSAMKKYLVEKGIPSDRILTDEKAENTKENFMYSKQLLENAGIGTDGICYITNSFHIYRAGVYAKQQGFGDITALSVKTDPAVFIPAVLREVCAVAAQMIFGY